MLPLKKTCLLSLVFLLLTGCGTSKIARDSVRETQIRMALYEQHSLWQGTPYRLGGLSKKGIDCSGFVYLTFKQQFGIILPRETKLQADTGNRISDKDLKAGDLVFFKTGWFTKHVGIYIVAGKFLHASTSKGVTMSNLNDAYWQSHYWKSTRVLK